MREINGEMIYVFSEFLSCLDIFADVCIGIIIPNYLTLCLVCLKTSGLCS